MKAIVCEAPFALGIAEKVKPIRSHGEVLVRITRVGLCGTDFHIFAGHQPYLVYPRIMGHELAGTVVEADDTSQLTAGQLVTINPYLPCGLCIACRKAKPNCCVNIKVLGVHTDGGMTEFVCVPASAVVAVSDLSPDQAAMIEFLSIGAHAVRRASTSTADRVLIVGAGPIGVGVALFATLAGAEVTLIDTSQQRLDYARDRVGIGQTCVVGEGLETYLRGRTDNEFFDIVFEATGNIKAIESGFAYVAHGGRYVLISIVKETITFSDPEFHKREMTLIGSRNATNDDFQFVINCIRSGQVPTEVLQTHAFHMLDMPTVIKDLIRDKDSVLKAIATL